MKGTYFRWTRDVEDTSNVGNLHADILGNDVQITAQPRTGLIILTVSSRSMDADTARMIGVRLIEAAALADNGRSVRER